LFTGFSFWLWLEHSNPVSAPDLVVLSQES